MSTARVVTIHILKYSGEYVVRPGSLAVDAGSQLRFVNLTDDYVVVSFPHEEFKDQSVRIGARGQGLFDVPHLKGRSPADAGKPNAKVFPYSAYTAEGQDFCRGGSVPIIIVED
jgi:hypothetical protein